MNAIQRKKIRNTLIIGAVLYTGVSFYSFFVSSAMGLLRSLVGCVFSLTVAYYMGRFLFRKMGLLPKNQLEEQ